MLPVQSKKFKRYGIKREYHLFIGKGLDEGAQPEKCWVDMWRWKRGDNLGEHVFTIKFNTPAEGYKFMADLRESDND